MQWAFNAFQANAAWLEIVLARPIWLPGPNSSDSLITDRPELARCEIETFCYRVLHVVARITPGARQTRLRIDATWRWAQAIATAWTRIRAAYT